MFKKIFTQLCNKAGESPTAVCLKVGLSNAAYSNWTDSSVPRRATLEAIAEHFGVTIDFLLGKETLESDSVLSDEEKAIINRYRAVNEETRTAIKKILENTHNGAVILLHPTSSTNAEILPTLIKEWRAMGYSFGTLSELTK